MENGVSDSSPSPAAQCWHVFCAALSITLVSSAVNILCYASQCNQFFVFFFFEEQHTNFESLINQLLTNFRYNSC